jgi:hypothetical protein
MTDSSLSVHEREFFLAQPHIAALSVSAGQSRGPFSGTVPETDELLREITERYLPPDKVQAYLDFAKAELSEQVVIYMRPQRWLTSDLGPGTLPPGMA